MNDVIELVRLINKTKLKSNGLLNVILEPGSMMEQLYEAIAAEQVSTDEEAKVLLYGVGKEASGYSNLKYKLKERLLDSVFLLDYKEVNYTERQKAFLDCYKRWAGAMILLIRNEKLNGIDQLEKLLRHTKRFEFTELTLDIARVLRLQYSTVDGDLKKYKDMREEYNKHEEIWIMESRAEDYYSDIMMEYTNSKSSKETVTGKAQEYYNALEPFMKKNESFKLHLFGRMIHLLIYNSKYDYVTTAQLCEDAIAFFNKKDYQSGLPLQVFYYNLIVCYLQLKEFDKGRAIADETLAMFEEGSFNWFKLQELFFLLSMHTGHYNDAYIIYDTVMNHPKFPNQMPQIVEMWAIFQAYLHYLVKVGSITLDSAQQTKFKLSKMLSDTNLFAKDKGGMNIPIIIIQILYLLADKKYNECSQWIDGIEKYLSRYVKGKDTKRSYNFIKMLIQLPKAQYHREAAARMADKYFTKLKEVPLEMANQTHEVEIVPYEVLWALTIETLELKIIKGK